MLRMEERKEEDGNEERLEEEKRLVEKQSRTKQMKDE